MTPMHEPVMRARVLGEAAISFEGANGRATHAPMVVADLNGIRTRVILDTGSDVHLLTKELADRLGLAARPGEDGTDHSGATMPSWSVDDVDLELAGLVLRLREVVAIPAPGPFADLGIGGILSPQRLHPTATATIDMRDDVFLLIEGPGAAIESYLRDRTPDLTMVPLARDGDLATVVVPAAIQPYAEVPTLVDTGGRGTEFAAAAVPGLVAHPDERLGGGVSGNDVVGGRAGRRTLVVAGHHTVVESLAVRPGHTDPLGLIGMDVLRGTVLSCPADRAEPVLWQVPWLG